MIEMSNRTPLPRSLSSAGPAQHGRFEAFCTGAKGSIPSRLARAGCCFATLGALLLLISAERPAVVTTEPSAAVQVHSRVNAVPPKITQDATCEDWAAWIPRRTDPAVVMQVKPVVAAWECVFCVVMLCFPDVYSSKWPRLVGVACCMCSVRLRDAAW